MRINVIKRTSVSAIVASFVTIFITTHATYAQFADLAEEGVGEVDDGLQASSAENVLSRIVDTLLYLVGAVAVIMIIIGGLRFLFASDQQSAAGARNTVFYSVIGLIVAVLSWAIVHQVLDYLY